MTGWSEDELRRIGAAEELQIAPVRRNGELRQPTTIWAVRAEGSSRRADPTSASADSRIREDPLRGHAGRPALSAFRQRFRCLTKHMVALLR
jgi:hypothetical protein